MTRPALLGIVALASIDWLPEPTSPFYKKVGPTTAGPKPRKKRSAMDQHFRQLLAEERRKKKAAKRLKQGKFL